MLRVRNFVSDKSGVTAIEYALIASLIAVFIIVAVQLVGTQCQHGVHRDRHHAEVSQERAPAAEFRLARDQFICGLHLATARKRWRGLNVKGLALTPRRQSGWSPANPRQVSVSGVSSGTFMANPPNVAPHGCTQSSDALKPVGRPRLRPMLTAAGVGRSCLSTTGCIEEFAMRAVRALNARDRPYALPENASSRRTTPNRKEVTIDQWIIGGRRLVSSLAGRGLCFRRPLSNSLPFA